MPRVSKFHIVALVPPGPTVAHYERPGIPASCRKWVPGSAYNGNHNIVCMKVYSFASNLREIRIRGPRLRSNTQVLTEARPQGGSSCIGVRVAFVLRPF
ncbi:uncharacterized protein RSE6_10001 [Rhynchosporium secalis]|uniref:Uncharacterized protein n=1 Tax=Rhynchosporium secalis TaxID=38038 RepID=A0A1E1MJF0_RHYSE|nr:uncharacterized protein RSE6_10001 [Rhynchosporium secalis]